MMRKETRFPLIADDEVIVGEQTSMNLYDESDLISNIRGPYQDREFDMEEVREPIRRPVEKAQVYEEDLLPPLFEAQPSPYSRRERLQKPTREVRRHQPVREANPSQKTKGQLAREMAREDIKRKKSAAYLQDDKPHPAKVVKREPIAPVVESRAEHLGNLADKLRQETYILADIPAVYSLKKEDRQEEQTTKKNSYDFLKKSQVYNYPEKQVQRERQVAQELNLTHIEEEVE
ncbi:hypothetical protein K6V33_09370 [Streptococcus suis]|nr:hypothetical protein [Streptococcus suis]